MGRCSIESVEPVSYVILDLVVAGIANLKLGSLDRDFEIVGAGHKVILALLCAGVNLAKEREVLFNSVVCVEVIVLFKVRNKL